MTKGRLEAFSDGVVAMLITVGVVVMWLVPDRRMERVIRSDRPQG